MWKARSEGTQPREGRPIRACVAVLAVVALMGAACGGTKARGEGVASANEGKGAASKASQQGAEQRAQTKDPDKAMLDFARCMRDHGVDMPDPKSGEGGTFRFEAPGSGAKMPDEPSFSQADKACRHLMGNAGPQLSPEDQKQMQDAMLAFARCMRDHGVEMPDPQSGGGIVAKVGEGADPRSPEFQAAEKDCRKHTEAADKKFGVARSER